MVNKEPDTTKAPARADLEDLGAALDRLDFHGGPGEEILEGPPVEPVVSGRAGFAGGPFVSSSAAPSPGDLGLLLDPELIDELLLGEEPGASMPSEAMLGEILWDESQGPDPRINYAEAVRTEDGSPLETQEEDWGSVTVAIPAAGFLPEAVDRDPVSLPPRSPETAPAGAGPPPRRAVATRSSAPEGNAPGERSTPARSSARRSGPGSPSQSASPSQAASLASAPHTVPVPPGPAREVPPPFLVEPPLARPPQARRGNLSALAPQRALGAPRRKAAPLRDLSPTTAGRADPGLLTPLRAAMASALLPGWGQSLNRERGKAWVFRGLALAAPLAASAWLANRIWLRLQSSAAPPCAAAGAVHAAAGGSLGSAPGAAASPYWLIAALFFGALVSLLSAYDALVVRSCIRRLRGAL
jgi:hypothetical protein